jgi:DNA-directed RNA polymerase specialized sigma24 family protein
MTLDEETLAVQGTEAHQRLDLLALDEAMRKLGALDPRLERLVELRYFAGCSMPEVSKQLGVSLRTVERDWTRARAYLRMLLEEDTDDEGTPADTEKTPADPRETPADPRERTHG